jgi:multiple sugar transport system substrate-binding protein
MRTISQDEIRFGMIGAGSSAGLVWNLRGGLRRMNEMGKRWCIMVSFLLAIVLLVSACGGGGANSAQQAGVGGAQAPEPDKSAAKPEEQKPVELKLFSQKLKLSDEEFQRWVVDPVKKAYPNITVKWYYYDGSKKTPDLEELWTQGVKPDILFASQYYAIEFNTKLKAVTDLRDLIKKYNVDINKFEPANMDAIKKYGANGEIYALPFASNFYGLWYNKELFDKFAVAYPKDGMTWDDAIALAAKMTRTDAGVQYHGLGTNGGDKMVSQWSLPFVDPKTDKVLLDQPDWTKAFTTLKGIFNIPGNFDEQMYSNFSGGPDQLRKDKTLAMVPYHNIISRLVESEKADGLKWDVAQYPSIPGKPNIYGEVQADSFMVASSSEYKDEAFKVIHLLTSIEVQTMINKEGKMTAFKDPKLKQMFGADTPELKTKNMAGIFKSAPAPLHPESIYEEDGTKVARSMYKTAMKGDKDINTTLREGKEELEKAIAALKGK